MPSRLIIGDIHGSYDQMLQVLDRARFYAIQDTLYCTGDIGDRGPDAVKCIRYVRALPHFMPVCPVDLTLVCCFQKRFF